MQFVLPPPHLIYCHGFASGPQTTSKGQALREQLGAAVSSMHIPDLQGEDFFTLTIDGMVERLLACIAALPADGAPVVLAGSSLGAWLCAWLASDSSIANFSQRIAGLILVAPAFGFVSRWREMLGDDGVAAWRAAGQRDFFHYRSGSELALGVGFLDSCSGLPDCPAPTTLPTLVIHGRRDEVASWRTALAYAEGCTAASFHLLDEGHSVDSLAATTFLIERSRALLKQVQEHNLP